MRRKNSLHVDDLGKAIKLAEERHHLATGDLVDVEDGIEVCVRERGQLLANS